MVKGFDGTPPKIEFLKKNCVISFFIYLILGTAKLYTHALCAHPALAVPSHNHYILFLLIFMQFPVFNNPRLVSWYPNVFQYNNHKFWNFCEIFRWFVFSFSWFWFKKWRSNGRTASHKPKISFFSQISTFRNPNPGK